MVDEPFSVRVFRKQWVLASRHHTEKMAWEYARDRYTKRLAPEDLKVEFDGQVPGFGWVLMMRTWTVTGEWKYAGLAKRHAELLVEQDPTEQVEVVDRNAKRERELLNYGRVLLR